MMLDPLYLVCAIIAVVIGAGGALALAGTNPSMKEYEAHAGRQLVTLATQELCENSGLPMVLDALAWAPQWLIDAVASLSFLIRFDSISKGVIDLRDLLFFVTLIAAWLAARDVDAVLVRPDHYVFGTSRGAQGAADLVARRNALIAGTTPQEIAA